jgi:hypothetical protein
VTTLKVGDRVRVTIQCSIPGYLPGDKGTVTRGPHTGPSGTSYFKVTMDKDDPASRGATFAADEIEPDA